MTRVKGSRGVHAPVVFLAVILALVAAAPAGAVGATIALAPLAGPPTTRVAVRGNGFGASEHVAIDFGPTAVGSATTSATGGVSTSFRVPPAAQPGPHTVTVTGQTSGLMASARFLVRTDWTRFRFNLAGSGTNPFENVLSTANVAGLVPAWTSPTNASLYSSPSVAGGIVYTGAGDGNVYALNAITGAVVWTHSTGQAVVSSPDIVKGVLYTGSGSSSVFASW